MHLPFEAELLAEMAPVAHVRTVASDVAPGGGDLPSGFAIELQLPMVSACVEVVVRPRDGTPIQSQLSFFHRF